LLNAEKALLAAYKSVASIYYIAFLPILEHRELYLTYTELILNLFPISSYVTLDMLPAYSYLKP